MAYYSLIAIEQNSRSWRTCAVFPASDKQSAVQYAKSLRDARHLSFVPHPNQFKLRKASRREISLLSNYLNKVNNSTLPTFQSEYLDSLLGKRRRLIYSFYVGMFLQPEVMKKNYGTETTPASTVSSHPSGGGGIEADVVSQDDQYDSPKEEISEEIEDDVVGELQSDQEMNHAEVPITDASEQEAALSALLSSTEATDKSTDSEEIDLDLM